MPKCEYCDTPYECGEECSTCAAEHARQCDYWFKRFRSEQRLTEDDLGAYELGNPKRQILEREWDGQR